MYNRDLLVKKIEDMFDDLKVKANEIISVNSNFDIASKKIIEIVSSETVTRSKTLITDMYSEMSRYTLGTEAFVNPEMQSKFFEANIRGDVLSKYNFEIDSLNIKKESLDFKEASRLYYSIAASAGTITLAGVLKFTLSNKQNVPLVMIIAGAVAVFCISYLKIMPEKNKAAFIKAVDIFLDDTMREFLKWFDEIEAYYDKRVGELVSPELKGYNVHIRLDTISKK